MRSIIISLVSGKGGRQLSPSVGGEVSIAHGVLDVTVAKVVLDRAGVLAVVGELVARRMTQHVRVNGKRYPGVLAGSASLRKSNPPCGPVPLRRAPQNLDRSQPQDYASPTPDAVEFPIIRCYSCGWRIGCHCNC
jgi:hypothetical protein